MIDQVQGLDPGYTALLASFENAIFWSAASGEKNMLVSPVVISSTATDSGNTVATTTLRAGLILGMKDSDGFYYKYDPTATDGTQIARAVLPYTHDTLGTAGSAVAKRVPVVVRANIVVSKLQNSDAAALRRLVQMGFCLDAPAGAHGLPGSIGTQEKAADYTVTAADNGKMFVATTGAVNFTLPTKAVGLKYRFLNSVDANMVITGSSDIIVDGGITRSTITYSTGSHKIGSFVEIECIELGGALKWLATNLGGTTMTLA